MSDSFKPSKNNPFMNYSLIDYTENKDRKKASIYDEKIKKEIKDIIFEDNEKEISITDKANRNFLERQFYSTPNTQIMSDQKGLGIWLYGNTGQCRDIPSQCDKNISNNYGFRYDKHY